MVDSYVDQLWDWLISSLADLVLGLLIALASWLASRWVKRFVSRTAKRLQWDEILWDYFGTVLRYLTLIVGWVSALKKIGFPVEAVTGHLWH